jgi:DNA-binding NarL/FixJ family response regulator
MGRANDHGDVIMANNTCVPESIVGGFAEDGRVSARASFGGWPKHARDGALPTDLRGLVASLHGSTDLLEPLGDTRDRAFGFGVAPSDCVRGPTRILVVDDCTLYRENLVTLLAVNDAVESTVAWDLLSLKSALEGCTPDIVLLTVSTRDSATLLKMATSTSPAAKVIAVGVSEDDESTIVACAEAGVTGYHLRSESLDDLHLLIHKLSHGESVCSPKVSAILLRRLSTLAAERKPSAEELVLTAREIQILRMLEMGLSNRDIADQLCIALHTVKNHVHSVLGKLGVRTRAQAVAVSRSFSFSQQDPGLELV